MSRTDVEQQNERIGFGVSVPRFRETSGLLRRLDAVRWHLWERI